MDLTDLVVHTRIKKDAFRRGGFAGINVSRDTDITVALDRGLPCHSANLAFLNLRAPQDGARTDTYKQVEPLSGPDLNFVEDQKR